MLMIDVWAAREPMVLRGRFSLIIITHHHKATHAKRNSAFQAKPQLSQHAFHHRHRLCRRHSGQGFPDLLQLQRLLRCHVNDNRGISGARTGVTSSLFSPLPCDVRSTLGAPISPFPQTTVTKEGKQSANLWPDLPPSVRSASSTTRGHRGRWLVMTNQQHRPTLSAVTSFVWFLSLISFPRASPLGCLFGELRRPGTKSFSRFRLPSLNMDLNSPGYFGHLMLFQSRLRWRWK
ncbi:hypothetical protein VTH06DRAFT_2210 [Thermothelomyces fergusii]